MADEALQAGSVYSTFELNFKSILEAQGALDKLRASAASPVNVNVVTNSTIPAGGGIPGQPSSPGAARGAPTGQTGRTAPAGGGYAGADIMRAMISGYPAGSLRGSVENMARQMRSSPADFLGSLYGDNVPARVRAAFPELAQQQAAAARTFRPSAAFDQAMNARRLNLSAGAREGQRLAYEDAYGGSSALSEGARKQMLSGVPLSDAELREEQVARLGGVHGAKEKKAGMRGKLLNWHNYFMATIATRLGAGLLDTATGMIEAHRAEQAAARQRGPAGVLAGVKGAMAAYIAAAKIPLAGMLGASIRNLANAFWGQSMQDITRRMQRGTQEAASFSQLMGSRLKDAANYATAAARYENVMGNHTAAAAWTMAALNDKYKDQVFAANQAYRKQMDLATSEQVRLNLSNELNTHMKTLAGIYLMQAAEARRTLQGQADTRRESNAAADFRWGYFKAHGRAPGRALVLGHDIATLRAQRTHDLQWHSVTTHIAGNASGKTEALDAYIHAIKLKIGDLAQTEARYGPMWHGRHANLMQQNALNQQLPGLEGQRNRLLKGYDVTSREQYDAADWGRHGAKTIRLHNDEMSLSHQQRVDSALAARKSKEAAAADARAKKLEERAKKEAAHQQKEAAAAALKAAHAQERSAEALRKAAEHLAQKARRDNQRDAKHAWRHGGAGDVVSGTQFAQVVDPGAINGSYNAGLPAAAAAHAAAIHASRRQQAAWSDAYHAAQLKAIHQKYDSRIAYAVAEYNRGNAIRGRNPNNTVTVDGHRAEDWFKHGAALQGKENAALKAAHGGKFANWRQENWAAHHMGEPAAHNPFSPHYAQEKKESESVTQLKHIAHQMDIVVRHILPSAVMPLFQAMGG